MLHFTGCVLCSPGCFSMFRGSALMDDNVMNMYTTKATEARHYVQYDQGKYQCISYIRNPYTFSGYIYSCLRLTLRFYCRWGQMALYTDVATRLQSWIFSCIWCLHICSRRFQWILQPGNLKFDNYHNVNNTNVINDKTWKLK